MVTDSFVPGQRWLSNNEPELGLGLVIKAERGRISLLYPATGQAREYAISNVPLTRIAFNVGDEVEAHDGKKFIVARVEEAAGVLTYYGHDEGVTLPETALADSLNFTRPYDRLINAQIDDRNLFNLRSKALHHRFETLRGHQRGFVGARIDLIPHQLFVALQMRRKGVPRVVLSDESGVGKAIESGLVLHRLIVTKRIVRALVIAAPENLSRWKYELEHRFNLPVTLVSPPEKRKKAVVPEDGVIVLAPPAALAPALKAGLWDVLVVDDADQVAVKDLKPLCDVTPGVILLTDLAPITHPEAHASLKELLDAGQGSVVVEPELTTALAEKLLAPAGPDLVWTEEEIAQLKDYTSLEIDPKALHDDALEVKERYLAALLEAVGAGRRLLRNTRHSVEGLPDRESIPEKITLSAEDETTPARLAALATEFTAKGEPNEDFVVTADDPRLLWLSTYLEGSPRDKVVLICATPEKAIAITEHLGDRAVPHHEGMTAAERAASVVRFTEKTDTGGAPVLVCSELASEARSLSFAHHMVLFDLPPDPVRIQKRIGGLDRYGHMAKVRVHVPYVEGTPTEVIFRWFSEALNLITKPCPVVQACAKAYRNKFLTAAQLTGEELTASLEKLLPAAEEHRKELLNKLHNTPDRLTALSSYRSIPATRLLESVRRLDSDLSLDFLMLRLFEHAGFDAEDVGERTYRVKPNSHKKAGFFPEIPETSATMTFERQRAVARDDFWFMTWDHPMVMNALEHLSDSLEGNSCYAVWEDLRSQILIMEALFRIELADNPPRLYTTRFFSPAGSRFIINHSLEDVSGEYPMELINRNVRNGRREWIRTNAPALRNILPPMMENLRTRAEARAAELSQTAITDMEAQLGPELERMKKLRERGGPVSDKEITMVTEEIETLRRVLATPAVRLDAIRLVRRGPAGKGI
jgi:ATP-dependent helicase HepA